MNNPFDGNSALSGDSQLDGLIHQLGVDSHQHSNLQSSESAVDSHNVSQYLDSASNSVHSGSETEHPSQHHSLHHSGSIEQHSFTQTDPFHLGLNDKEIHHEILDKFGDSALINSSFHPLIESSYHPIFEHSNSLHELKTDNHIGSNPDFASTDLSNLIVTNSEDNSSSHHYETAAHSHLVNEAQILNYTDSGAITPDDVKSIEFIGDKVWWHGSGWGQAGTVAGHKFYRGDEYIGRLGADLNVYNADGHKIGYVTPSGQAYSPNGRLFATGGTARWAAATLVFNTCTES